MADNRILFTEWARVTGQTVLHYAPEALAHVGASASCLGHDWAWHEEMTDWRDFIQQLQEHRTHGS